MLYDVYKEFPLIYRNRGSLVYLDNAASTQKPSIVIEALADFYFESYANVHRGIYKLAEKATALYEEAREKIAWFIGGRKEEVVFVRGTTEGINLLAYTLSSRLSAGDEIVISVMEHHSNFVPWQIVTSMRSLNLKVVDITEEGDLDWKDFENKITEKTKVVAITHLSNVLGTLNDIRKVVEIAHSVGAVVIVDGAQAVARLKVDVEELGCDFYTFSGHKMYGPMGIGVLWGRYELLEELPPWQGGGEMIEKVTVYNTSFRKPPHRFEAGTPNVAGAVALSKAVDFISSVGIDNIEAQEDELVSYILERFGELRWVSVVGSPKVRKGVVSFTVDGVHPHDVATILGNDGIAIRAGHHCAQPLMDRLSLSATSRISLGCYNTKDEIDMFFKSLENVRKVFA